MVVVVTVISLLLYIFPVFGTPKAVIAGLVSQIHLVLALKLGSRDASARMT